MKKAHDVILLPVKPSELIKYGKINLKFFTTNFNRMLGSEQIPKKKCVVSFYIISLTDQCLSCACIKVGLNIE